MKLKKLLSGLLCAVIAAATLFVCAGCAGANRTDEPKKEEAATWVRGEFYTLQQAYDNRRITESDVRELSYRRWRNVYVVSDDEDEWQDSENWTKLNYTPINQSDAIDERLKADILNTYFAEHTDSFLDKNGNKIGGVEDLELAYFGQYNGLYAVMIESSLWSYPADVRVERYGNTVLYITRCPIYFFKPAD